MKIFTLYFSMLLALTAWGCAFTDDRLDRICAEQGYTITAQEPQSLTLTVPTSPVPADLSGIIGFDEGEIVCAQIENSVIWLRSVRKSSDTQLCLSFDMTCTPPESGTILLPYQINKYIDGYSYAHAWYVDNDMDHALMMLHGSGPNEKFYVYIQTDRFFAEEDFVFTLNGFNAMTYYKN